MHAPMKSVLAAGALALSGLSLSACDGLAGDMVDWAVSDEDKARVDGLVNAMAAGNYAAVEPQLDPAIRQTVEAQFGAVQAAIPDAHSTQIITANLSSATNNGVSIATRTFVAIASGTRDGVEAWARIEVQYGQESDGPLMIRELWVTPLDARPAELDMFE